MKKFIGKINDRVYTDETVFQYALNDIIRKGLPFTSSSESVEVPDEFDPEETIETGDRSTPCFQYHYFRIKMRCNRESQLNIHPA